MTKVQASSLDDPRRVLVVEDEPRLREMLLRAIPEMGFSPAGAASGESAVRLMENGVLPAVAILDLNLPGMSGLELFELIRKRWPAVEVIVLTGFGDLETAKRAIRLDVVDFLTKPCTLGDLEVAIDRAWQRWRGRRGRGPEPGEGLQPAAAGVPSDGGATDQTAARSLQDLERRHILEALDRHNGNRTAAAAELGISVRTLYYRLSEYERKGLLG